MLHFQGLYFGNYKRPIAIILLVILSKSIITLQFILYAGKK